MELTFVDKDYFESLTRGMGFHAFKLYGNYDRSPFEAGRSPVMIWVLQKGGAQPSAATEAPPAARRSTVALGIPDGAQYDA